MAKKTLILFKGSRQMEYRPTTLGSLKQWQASGWQTLKQIDRTQAKKERRRVRLVHIKELVQHKRILALTYDGLNYKQKPSKHLVRLLTDYNPHAGKLQGLIAG